MDQNFCSKCDVELDEDGLCLVCDSEGNYDTDFEDEEGCGVDIEEEF
ncbi:hypothetical protein ACFLY0_02070 [Patescibacteria group bacterium]